MRLEAREGEIKVKLAARPEPKVDLAPNMAEIYRARVDELQPVLAAGSEQRARVIGPILTTRSQHDAANRVFYPLGAGVAGPVVFEPEALPKYAAIGTFGAQGTKIPAVDRPMLDVTSASNFERKSLYNLEASAFIKRGGAASGAHNDIDGRRSRTLSGRRLW